MTYWQSVGYSFSNIFNFSGRASRSEYWNFFWITFLLAMLYLSAVMFPIWLPMVTHQAKDMAFATAYIGFVAKHPKLFDNIMNVVLLVLTLSIHVRRLHDVNRNGWWILAFAIPLVGVILWLVWTSRHGTIGPNDYGDDPINPGKALESRVLETF